MLKIAWSEIYNHPLPQGHRFPMIKYDLLREQLLHEGTIGESNLFLPVPLDRPGLELVHYPAYIDKLESLNLTKSEIRMSGFPLSKTLIQREKSIMGGTVQAVQWAFHHGVSMNIAGGTHHAYADRAEGFCIFNDIALAVCNILQSNPEYRILIIDLDVHQGNGTARIFKNDERVFTFSMHGKNNYPLKKEKSDLDIPLEDGIKDREYLYILNASIQLVMENFSPDFIFYQCGVDILETDKLGRLNITIEGCRSRDSIVLNLAKSNGIPLVAAMGGGYSPQIKDIIEAHANTFRLASEIYF